MEYLFVGVLDRQLLLFLLYPAHELLRVLVAARHDVANAQVGQHYGRHLQDVVLVLLDDGLVVLDGFLEFTLLHEEHVRHV